MTDFKSEGIDISNNTLRMNNTNARKTILVFSQSGICKLLNESLNSFEWSPVFFITTDSPGCNDSNQRRGKRRPFSPQAPSSGYFTI